MSKSHLLAAADGGVIQGCYTKIGGILRVIDSAKGERCLGIEVPISWNQKGLKGDPGANGAPGVSPTVAQLQPGDSNCPAGGAAITDAAGSTAYACNGADFAGTLTSPNGEYSISVTDTGITLAHGPTTSIKLVGDSLDLRSAGSTEVRAATTAKVESELDLDLRSGTSAELRAGTSAKIHAGGDFTVEGVTGLIQSTGVLNLKGSAINLN